ncbi:hypothetical protein CBOM_04532 [Ceraceosorus bombacis]|uniref:Uncharacterized protein n=1 Tax=Ceraceosorus bombacis TaxID=401625 RepID=A0A0P1BMP1_9BASI|nr:hypothetical protein CBOM_04532 [Ceraceosorus bombacis]
MITPPRQTRRALTRNSPSSFGRATSASSAVSPARSVQTPTRSSILDASPSGSVLPTPEKAASDTLSASTSTIATSSTPDSIRTTHSELAPIIPFFPMHSSRGHHSGDWTADDLSLGANGEASHARPDSVARRSVSDARFDAGKRAGGCYDHFLLGGAIPFDDVFAPSYPPLVLPAHPATPLATRMLSAHSTSDMSPMSSAKDATPELETQQAVAPMSVFDYAYRLRTSATVPAGRIVLRGHEPKADTVIASSQSMPLLDIVHPRDRNLASLVEESEPPSPVQNDSSLGQAMYAAALSRYAALGRSNSQASARTRHSRILVRPRTPPPRPVRLRPVSTLRSSPTRMANKYTSNTSTRVKRRSLGESVVLADSAQAFKDVSTTRSQIEADSNRRVDLCAGDFATSALGRPIALSTRESVTSSPEPRFTLKRKSVPVFVEEEEQSISQSRETLPAVVIGASEAKVAPDPSKPPPLPPKSTARKSRPASPVRGSSRAGAHEQPISKIGEPCQDPTPLVSQATFDARKSMLDPSRATQLQSELQPSPIAAEADLIFGSAIWSSAPRMETLQGRHVATNLLPREFVHGDPDPAANSNDAGYTKLGRRSCAQTPSRNAMASSEITSWLQQHDNVMQARSEAPMALGTSVERAATPGHLEVMGSRVTPGATLREKGLSDLPWLTDAPLSTSTDERRTTEDASPSFPNKAHSDTAAIRVDIEQAAPSKAGVPGSQVNAGGVDDLLMPSRSKDDVQAILNDFASEMKALSSTRAPATEETPVKDARDDHAETLTSGKSQEDERGADFDAAVGHIDGRSGQHY